MLLKEEITQYVINALGRHRSRNDIIEYLCTHANMQWSEAEKLVRQIEARHGSEIHARQSPLIILLGITGMIGGLILIAYCLFYFLILPLRDPDLMIRSSRGALNAIIALIGGISLITGSIVGTWKTIKEWFEHRENR
jgi:hypothetical protein